MKDVNDWHYETLVSMQDSDLQVWSKRIQAHLMKPIREYVLSGNREATSERDSHRVWRGQDIVEIIRCWPAPAPGFPPIRNDQDLI